MPIRPPVLDDRNYDSFVEELIARIPGHTPEWTHVAPGDPGLTLIELFSWMADALLYRVNLIPERQRLVIVGYFLENRTSLELAHFLGVTESRISQLRSEALAMLKEGIERQYEGTEVPTEEPVGRVAKRKAHYAEAIGEASAWKSRLDQVITDDIVEDEPLPVGVPYHTVGV